MRADFKGISRRLTVAGAALAVVATSAVADIVGQPVDKGIDMQPAASQIRADQIVFNNYILSPIIIAIAGFVLVMLAIIIIRFNKRANPEPARFSHNTPIEIIWTVVPILILMFIAIFSFRLLFEEHDMPKPDMTVKVTGRQWNWDYEYPDQKISAYTSTPMTEADAKAKDAPYLLATNAPMVVPVNKVVRVQLTAEDVIHSWSVPAFGVKIDAIPGRLNQTWFKADRTGVFYGQCSQLCGANHSYMPIEVRVVSQADFDAWAASKQPKPAVTVASAAPATVVAAAPAAPAANH
jgi:cytochrome c oxidase subunit 2